MTFTERNNQIIEPINSLIEEFKAIHDKYTSSSRILSNEDWEAYVNAMDKIKLKRKGALRGAADYLKQYFLDDTEYVQKELKKINDKL